MTPKQEQQQEAKQEALGSVVVQWSGCGGVVTRFCYWHWDWHGVVGNSSRFVGVFFAWVANSEIDQIRGPCVRQ